MKKNLAFVAAVLLAAAMLVSCGTTVAVKDHIPAEVNMSGMKNLAVASVTVKDSTTASSHSSVVSTVTVGSGNNSHVRIFSSWSSDLPKKLGNYAQAQLLSDLHDSDYFALSEPSKTDALFSEGKMLGQTRSRFMNAGIDAILSSRMTIISFDEYITSELRQVYDTATSANKTVGIDYYLETELILGFEYNVIGVEQNTLVSSDSYTKTVYDKTLAATFMYGASGGVTDGYFSYAISSGPNLYPEYRKALDSMVANVAVALAPRWEYSTETLMSNSAKIESLKIAYEYAGDGNYTQAFDIFDSEWKSSNDLSSGYNAAILLYARGKLSDAVTYMNNVASVTGSGEAYSKAAALKQKLRMAEIAEQQVNGTASDATVEEFEIKNFFGR